MWFVLCSHLSFLSLDALTVFYISLRIYNSANKDVTVISSDNDPDSGIAVSAAGDVQYTKELDNPEPIEFTAFDPENNEPLMINNQKKFILYPSKERGAYKSLNIKPGMKNIRAFLTHLLI